MSAQKLVFSKPVRGSGSRSENSVNSLPECMLLVSSKQESLVSAWHVKGSLVITPAEVALGETLGTAVDAELEWSR